MPGEMPSDESLIEKVLSGDDEAFAEVVRRHKRKVFAIVARYARDDGELDDVCQEIFIKMYQNLRKYRGDAPFEHWLSRIAVNACYDMLRRRRRAGEEVAFETVEYSLSGPSGEEMAGNEAWAILKNALAKLCPEDRLVITLLHLEEKSVTEISVLTGWSGAKVKVRAFRARKELKRILEDSHGR